MQLLNVIMALLYTVHVLIAVEMEGTYVQLLNVNMVLKGDMLP